MGTLAVALAGSVSKSNSKSIEYDTRNSKLSVLRKGLEPLHLAVHAPQTCLSTNSNT